MRACSRALDALGSASEDDDDDADDADDDEIDDGDDVVRLWVAKGRLARRRLKQLP